MAKLIELTWWESNDHIIQTAANHPSEFVQEVKNEFLHGFGTADKISQFRVRVPLQEDIALNLDSSFTSVGDLLGSISGGLGSLVENLQTVQTVFSGQTSDMFSYLNLKVWKGTEPLVFNLKLQFNVKKDGWGDVWVPAVSLSSLSILKQTGGSIKSYDKDGTPKLSSISPGLRVPGVNLANYAATKSARGIMTTDGIGEVIKIREKKNKEAGSKSNKDKKQSDTGRRMAEATDAGESSTASSGFLHVKIPGILEIKDGFIEKCQTTFSKHETISGAPLWAELNMTISSTRPAFDKQLSQQDSRYLYLKTLHL